MYRGKSPSTYMFPIIPFNKKRIGTLKRPPPNNVFQNGIETVKTAFKKDRNTLNMLLTMTRIPKKTFNSYNSYPVYLYSLLKKDRDPLKRPFKHDKNPLTRSLKTALKQSLKKPLSKPVNNPLKQPLKRP